jgi:hypothetical protein
MTIHYILHTHFHTKWSISNVLVRQSLPEVITFDTGSLLLVLPIEQYVTAWCRFMTVAVMYDKWRNWKNLQPTYMPKPTTEMWMKQLSAHLPSSPSIKTKISKTQSKIKKGHSNIQLSGPHATHCQTATWEWVRWEVVCTYNYQLTHFTHSVSCRIIQNISWTNWDQFVILWNN